MSDNELIESLTLLLPPWLRGRFHGWLTQSASFKAFANDNEAKIRSKLKNAKSNEFKADVVAELEIACRLLANSSISLIYEPFGANEEKNPDFLAIYNDYSFLLEVKRIRGDGRRDRCASLCDERTGLALLANSLQAERIFQV